MMATDLDRRAEDSAPYLPGRGSATGRLLLGKAQEERRALVDGALSPNTSAVAMDDAPDVGEADADAFELIGRVQPLKDAEKFVGIFHVKSDAVVADKKGNFVVRLGTADLDFSPLAGARVLQGIGKQIDDGLAKHQGIALDNG